MAHFTGTASSPADLLTKMKTHLGTDLAVADRWTIDTNVIYKDGCYVELISSTNYVRIVSGTGINTGSITGVPPQWTNQTSRKREAALGSRGQAAIAWPAIYFINVHTDPHDEVWVTVKNGDEYCHMAWGKSPASGLPGTGNWYYGHISIYQAELNSGQGFQDEVWDSRIGTNTSPSFYEGGAMFGTSVTTSGSLSNTSSGLNYSMHHGLDGNEWTGNGSATNGAGIVSASGYATTECMLMGLPGCVPIYWATPNTFNNQVVLVNCPLFISRGLASDNSSSIIGQLGIMRHVRIDYLQAEDILTIGSDKWQIFPCVKRDPANPNGRGSSRDDSGFHGYAIRYDGA